MYRALVERLARRPSPISASGADVITGFPGETDADFEATEALVEALPFTYLHVFSYSDRRGTEAARRPTPARAARDDPAAHDPAPAARRREAASGSAGPRSAASCSVLVLEQPGPRDRTAASA